MAAQSDVELDCRRDSRPSYTGGHDKVWEWWEVEVDVFLVAAGERSWRFSCFAVSFVSAEIFIKSVCILEHP
jgi:hypothetical protein